MLTEQQEAIISTDERHCVVKAGAGTGKTRVIVHRVNELIGRGINPKGIVVATFSRAAAKEMRERLGSTAKQVHVGTFHSVCLEAMPERPAVMGDHEAISLLTQCCLECGEATKTRKGVKWRKGSAKTWKRDVDLRLPSPVLRNYLSKMSMQGVTDYATILHRGIELSMKGQFNPTHLIVDEAQDNDALQWHLTEVVAQKAEVMIVGDKFQSIHCWRGAQPEKLDIEWPAFPLTETFRCPEAVVDFVNRIEGIDIKLSTSIPGGVLRTGGDTMSDIKAALTKYDPEDIAILCRYNSDADYLAVALENEGIRVGRNKMMERGPLYRLMRYLASPHSEAARNEARDIAKACNLSTSKLGMYIASARPARTILPLIESEVGRLTPVELIESLTDKGATIFAGEYSWLKERYSHESLDYFRREESSGLLRQPTCGITVGTMHSAKGLEWPCVIVLSDKLRKNRDERLLYVATTRAKDSLVLPGKAWEQFIRQGE